MRQVKTILVSTVMALIISCNNDKNIPDRYTICSQSKTFNIVLLQEQNSNVLQCWHRDTLTSQWPLPYPVYQFQAGDINDDGNDDIAIGVIKRTRRDSVVRKRLFLFQVRNKMIIPLWLGSSLGHPLVDFRLCNTSDSATLVRSVEMEKNQKYLVAHYEWFGFGLSFREYLERDISYDEAMTLLAR